jgi:hypothetical protein
VKLKPISRTLEPVENLMNEKSTPIATKFLASLGVLNFLATLFCMITIFYFRESMAVGVAAFPAAQMLISIIIKAISGLTWLFVIFNMAVSLAFMIAAFIARNANQPLSRQEFAKAA